MLSLCELRRATRVLDERMTGYRVERIVQTDAYAVVFTLYGRDADSEQSAKLYLRVSCAPGLGRVSLCAGKQKAPETPLPFARFLRARLPGARLQGATLRSEDRQLALRFESREGEFTLLLSLLGNRSNVYLLGSSGSPASSKAPDSTEKVLAAFLGTSN